MFRRISHFVKMCISARSKEKKYSVARSDVFRAAKNKRAAEAAAREVVTKYGETLKSLSSK